MASILPILTQNKATLFVLINSTVFAMKWPIRVYNKNAKIMTSDAFLLKYENMPVFSNKWPKGVYNKKAKILAIMTPNIAIFSKNAVFVKFQIFRYDVANKINHNIGPWPCLVIVDSRPI
jgi:hypothetical protein